MRLLHAKELTFKEFIGAKIPPYAIISHRWSEKEVSHQDYLNDREAFLQGERLSYGWIKIKEASRITQRRGYEWFWIDTYVYLALYPSPKLNQQCFQSIPLRFR